MTQVGDPVTSAGIVGRVTRVIGSPPNEQIYVDWTAGPPLVPNPKVLSDEWVTVGFTSDTGVELVHGAAVQTLKTVACPDCAGRDNQCRRCAGGGIVMQGTFGIAE